MDYESIKAVEPDIEVTVRVGELEIAVIGCFQNKRNVWDVVFGIDDVARVGSLVTLFTLLTDTLPLATFNQIRTSGSSERSEMGSESSF